MPGSRIWLGSRRKRHVELIARLGHREAGGAHPGAGRWTHHELRFQPRRGCTTGPRSQRCVRAVTNNSGAMAPDESRLQPGNPTADQHPEAGRWRTRTPESVGVEGTSGPAANRGRVGVPHDDGCDTAAGFEDAADVAGAEAPQLDWPAGGGHQRVAAAGGFESDDAPRSVHAQYSSVTLRVRYTARRRRSCCAIGGCRTPHRAAAAEVSRSNASSPGGWSDMRSCW